MRLQSLLKFGILFVGLWLLLEWTTAGDYIERLKYGEQYAVFSSFVLDEAVSADDPEALRQSIEQAAAELYVAPIDARIDSVWKAIPGLNGKEVDIEATVRLAQRMNGQVTWVYRDVPPRVMLDDLGSQPIYKGNPNKEMVSLMFNVAWGEEHLPSLLGTLDQARVKATFFLDGRWLAKHPEEAKKIQAGGHEISNHGYSHRLMSGLSRAEATKEIAQTEALLEDILQVDNSLYAPAAGDYNEMTLQIAQEHNLKTVLWTLDTIDWKNPAPDTILQRIVPRLEPGAMILMHPTEPTSQALAQMITEIKQKGYTLGTVSELLSPRRINQVEHKLKLW